MDDIFILYLKKLQKQQLIMNRPRSNSYQITSSTEELAQLNKKMILQDKLNSYNKNFPPIQQLQILDQELILKEKVLKPFWNNCSKEISKKLWLPTKIDGQDLDFPSFNGCFKNLVQNFKFNIHPQIMSNKTLPMTSWRLSPSLVPDIMEDENIKILTKKIKFIPTKEQILKFNKFFGTSRYMYNKCVTEINKRYEDRKQKFNNSLTCVNDKCNNLKEDNNFLCKKHKNKSLPWKLDITLPSIRSSVMKNNKELKGTENEWEIETPNDTRQLIIKDAITAYKSATTNLIRGNISHFRMSYKSKKSVKKIFWIRKASIKRTDKGVKLFSRYLNNPNLKFKKRDLKKLPKEINHDCKIMKDGSSYYLVLSVDYEQKELEHKQPFDIVANDQGIRTFTTMFSNEMISETGSRETELINKLCKRIDLLKIQKSLKRKEMKKQNKKYKLKNIKRKIRKHFKKIRDVVFNLHNQVISFQTSTYKSIILPEFGTSKMKRGYLTATTKRQMDLLSFYKFTQKMKLACHKKNVNLYTNCDESYTTKTCTNCGYLNNVGDKKIITCESCKLTISRDINGARNILLKHLSN